MIVAGIGSRRGVTADEVVAAIDAALATYRLARKDLTGLATTDFKQDETGIWGAADKLGLTVLISNAHATLTTPSPLWGGIEGGGALACLAAGLRLDQQGSVSAPPPLTPPHTGEGVANGVRTHSPLSLAMAGLPSVSETAALLAAGPGATLLGPRLALGRVTCALAKGGAA